jgi:hypothetical protein
MDSMRRTKAAQIYCKTEPANLRAVQLLLGHTSIVRYFGIEVDDALNISEQIEL